MLALLPFMGVGAGMLTTVAGLGGGIVLMLALSLVMDPAQALAATAPALLVGNAHRALLYRHRVDWGFARRFLFGAVPGSIAGGAVLAALPGGLVRGLMIAMLGLCVARATGLLRFRPAKSALAPAGFGIGALAATSGGAGLLVSPLLMSAAVVGDAYIATAATIATGMHVGRLAAYGAAGLMAGQTLAYAAVLTITILVGNVLGQRIRGRLTARTAARLETGAVVAGALLALLGVIR